MHIFNSICFSLKLHNEDDPAESTVEQPSTSTQTAPACQTEASSPEVDTSPPPYCSIATEAAAPTGTVFFHDYITTPGIFSNAEIVPPALLCLLLLTCLKLLCSVLSCKSQMVLFHISVQTG